MKPIHSFKMLTLLSCLLFLQVQTFSTPSLFHHQHQQRHCTASSIASRQSQHSKIPKLSCLQMTFQDELAGSLSAPFNLTDTNVELTVPIANDYMTVASPTLNIPSLLPFPSTPPPATASLNDNPSILLHVNVCRLLVLLAAAMYGTNFGLVKLLDTELPLAVSASVRFGLAAVVVTGAVWMQEQWQDRASLSSQEYKDSTAVVPITATESSSSTTPTLPPTLNVHADRWASLVRGLEVGMWYAIGYWCQAQGLSLVEASKSAFFNALAVLVVPLLDWCLRHKPLRAVQWMAVVSALVGVGLVEWSGGNSSSDSSMRGVVSSTWNTVSMGDVYCLLQAFFFGIGYWRLEDASQTYPQQAARITVGQLLAVAGGSWIYWGATSLWKQQSLGMDFMSIPTSLWTEPWIWGALVWTGLVSTALALFLETVALQAVSAAELTLLMTTVSLWGSAFAYVALGEVLPPLAWVGGFLILGSCVLTTQRNQEE
jgi:drug/metabolite transporter (DMT)-like permease